VLAAALVLAAAGSAVAQTAPPPTPGPDGSPSPSPTVLVKPPTPALDPPELDVPAAVLLDLRSGQLLLAVGPDRERPIASTTKIMTAVVVTERASLDDVVTVSEFAAAQGGSEAGLEPGEEITVRELLYALLLSSANDAAVALAEHVSGSVDAFVDVMNARAAQLGLGHTDYASPSGLDDAGYSTARNLADLTRFVYRRPEAPSGVIEEIVRQMFHDVPAPEGEPRHLQNRNALLWLYPGTIGVKTGQTEGAGFTLVAVADREDRRLLAVVLGGEDEVFSEAAALFDYGFDGFEESQLVQAGEELERIEAGGRTYPAIAADGLVRLVPVGDEVVVERSVLLKDIGAPPTVEPGQRVGRVEVSVGEKKVGTVQLVAGEPLPQPSPEVTDSAAGGPWWPVVTSGALLIGVLVGLSIFRAVRRPRP
jgi:serine-type D-Ala-D-Ala carboxypeptidase (penicillin-binding protein 5/6)